MRLFFPLLLVGCGSSWLAQDLDGDGWTAADGDCFDNPDQDANGIAAADIHPGASNETWYDGVDQNCDGANDYDKDADGHPAAEFDGGDDCWDDPDGAPAAFLALSGFYQPLAREVHPGAEETWYDGVDENCDTGSDFDQDGDRVDTLWHEQSGGVVGEDCFDAEADPFENPALAEPENVNPDAVETWYDGTDANCDGADDYDQDADGWVVDEECDDLDPEIYPNDAAETWYDGIDSNCDGHSDFDQDDDGYDSADYDGDDCNDDPAAPASGRDGASVDAEDMHPNAGDTPYDEIDADCAGDSDFDADGDGQDADDVAGESGLFGTDCDDDDGTVYTGAAELWYDAVDADCSGGSDFDQDGDGFDSSSYGYGTSDDCDDASAAVHPSTGADPVDEDCSTVADDDCTGTDNDEDAAGCVAHFLDGDADGYGKLADSGCFCEESGSYTVTGVTAANDDCNDAKSTVNPGITVEDCDTADDDDCDGDTNELGGDNCEDWYGDADADGYGVGPGACYCSATSAFSSSFDDDCDDADDTVHPGAAETCDLADEDCDGAVDEGVTHYYTDTDGDLYGDDATETCSSGGGRVATGGDCDDGDERVFPTAPELCDEQQNDCDAATWSTTDEDGTASYATTADVWTSVTTAWAAGTSSTVASISLASTGSYHVCPGTWYVSLVAAGGDDVDVLAPYGAADTTLDRAGTLGPLLSVTDSSVSMEGLTLTGGTGQLGGAARYGGAVLSYATTSTAVASVVLIDCEVTGNTATYGGGLAAYNYGDITLTSTEVYDNTATNGGGLFTQRGDIVATGGGVHDNTSTGEGGGAYFSTNQGSLTVTGGDWSANSVDDAAGASGGFGTEPDASYGSSADFSCAGNTGCTP